MAITRLVHKWIMCSYRYKAWCIGLPSLRDSWRLWYCPAEYQLWQYSLLFCQELDVFIWGVILCTAFLMNDRLRVGLSCFSTPIVFDAPPAAKMVVRFCVFFFSHGSPGVWPVFTFFYCLTYSHELTTAEKWLFSVLLLNPGVGSALEI